ncbi:MAG TPA: hypothetical protein PKE00_17035, partial [Planctomycetota bacterium]|nr:hypothetical protein [Planctomycetota bacterium]
EWCRRLKRTAGTGIVLLVHDPTRAAVARAFRCGADAILGVKSRERDISDKLAAIVEKLAPHA